MTEEQCNQASNILYHHWLKGTRIDALPTDLRPLSRSEAYKIQSRLELHTYRPQFGWKIAATSKIGQHHIGVEGPLAGRLLAERKIANAGMCPLGNNLMKVAELEFAFQMANDMPPRTSPYKRSDLLDNIAFLYPAIEIPDSRYNKFQYVGDAQLIADNACAHYFVLGSAANESWRTVDLVRHNVFAYLNDVLVQEGQGANVLGDPIIALTWLVNELCGHAMTLRSGHIVMTGTCVKPVVINQGDRFAGDFGFLGQVSVNIA